MSSSTAARGIVVEPVPSRLLPPPVSWPVPGATASCKTEVTWPALAPLSNSSRSIDSLGIFRHKLAEQSEMDADKKLTPTVESSRAGHTSFIQRTPAASRNFIQRPIVFSLCSARLVAAAVNALGLSPPHQTLPRAMICDHRAALSMSGATYAANRISSPPIPRVLKIMVEHTSTPLGRLDL